MGLRMQKRNKTSVSRQIYHGALRMQKDLQRAKKALKVAEELIDKRGSFERDDFKLLNDFHKHMEKLRDV